jgi:diguanylate cyclase (GGDEF)-like protein
MCRKLHHHLSVACKAAFFAFNRSSRNGETLHKILGYTDTLTGIPNRKSFEEDRITTGTFQTFILIDVDNLKQLNDTFGHLFGDTILRGCAHILSKSVEKIGKVYRLAGDEFALIVPQCWVKTVCLYIKNRVKEDGRFTLSMGVASPCGTEGLTEAHFKEAETALYQCKHNEPNIYSEFLTDDFNTITAPGELKIENNLSSTSEAVTA